MTRLYYWGLASGFAVSLSIVSVYYFFTFVSDASESITTETQFAYTRVEGALQPLPEVVYINENWRDLGKALFNSTLLSADNTISCASCHLVDFGGDDGFPVSTGINSATGSRNSPSVLNAVFNVAQFWDGRSASLAEQVEGPVHNPLEMGTNWEQVIAKLNDDDVFYNMFAEISSTGISKEAIVKAITTYEESLVTHGAPIDRYLLGDKTALTAQQVKGLEKFQQFGCVSCHQGVNIGGNLFQKIGRINDVSELFTGDLGRYSITGKDHDKYVFKVPSLRNVAETAPYFHNGEVATLYEAIEIMGLAQLGRALSPQDIRDLEALLQSFSSPLESS